MTSNLYQDSKQKFKVFNLDKTPLVFAMTIATDAYMALNKTILIFNFDFKLLKKDGNHILLLSWLFTHTVYLYVHLALYRT